jgi:UDP:flavonoid glycosyltransferase YjiC (YdhE family)
MHHGGAGTTSCGLRHGRPTAIVPFFGYQKFWGDAVYGAGAGPAPVPFRKANVDVLTDAIKTLLSPAVVEAAETLGQGIRAEKGEVQGAAFTGTCRSRR